MAKKAAIIIPSTGAPQVRKAIESCLASGEEDIQVLAVVDGEDHRRAFERNTEGLDDPRLQTVILPGNVGAYGFYGHRIYAAFTYLVNTDHVLFLDQDNFFAPGHIPQILGLVEKDGLEWAYALRRICGADGAFITDDDCESLGRWPSWQGYNLVDTSCYCFTLKTALSIANVWFGRWGQDRVVTHMLLKHFPRNACTGKHTVNYVANAEYQLEFIHEGNGVMRERYPGGFPWAQP
jgi:hypothetical protein